METIETIQGTITAVGGQVIVHAERYNMITMQMVLAGTSAATYQFEVSNNSTNGTNGNWFAVMAARTNSNTQETNTGALSATPAYGWEVGTAGWDMLRIRCSAATTAGTATLSIGASASSVEPAPSIGTHAVTQSGAFTTTPLTPTASAINSAASTNAAVVKATAGNLYGSIMTNAGASTAYLKLYNKTTAPTVGTDIPVAVIVIPAGQTVSTNFGSLGLRFTSGIGRAITGGIAHTDTTAVAAAQVFGSLSYV
jgi:hypothetical protein